MSVRVNCPDCGDVSISSSEITLRQCVDDRKRSSYNFGCPSCGRRVVHQCLPKIADLILSLTDVRIEPWFLPVELFEQHVGPPISVDDVIDFHQALNP